MITKTRVHSPLQQYMHPKPNWIHIHATCQVPNWIALAQTSSTASTKPANPYPYAYESRAQPQNIVTTQSAVSSATPLPSLKCQVSPPRKILTVVLNAPRGSKYTQVHLLTELLRGNMLQQGRQANFAILLAIYAIQKFLYVHLWCPIWSLGLNDCSTQSMSVNYSSTFLEYCWWQVTHLSLGLFRIKHRTLSCPDWWKDELMPATVKVH